jgi:hypothetical protein
VALAAFIRAILLNNDPAARGLAPVVIDSYPQLKPSLETWLAAKSPDQLSFAAAFMMLKNPGLKFALESGAGRDTPLDELDSFRDNWWGSQTGQVSDDQPAPGFLSAAEKKSAHDEWISLSAINAPNLLCKAALEQSRNHPNDPRAPEALYRCIRAVHLGCSNLQSAEFAKSAFVQLHSRYPKSTWSNKNKVWSKGTGSCR